MTKTKTNDKNQTNRPDEGAPQKHSDPSIAGKARTAASDDMNDEDQEDGQSTSKNGAASKGGSTTGRTPNNR